MIPTTGQREQQKSETRDMAHAPIVQDHRAKQQELGHGDYWVTPLGSSSQ